jgi:hypothetical protein
LAVQDRPLKRLAAEALKAAGEDSLPFLEQAFLQLMDWGLEQEGVSEGRMAMEKSWNQLLEEASRIAQRIRTASIILLLMVFAMGLLVGLDASRLS